MTKERKVKKTKKSQDGKPSFENVDLLNRVRAAALLLRKRIMAGTEGISWKSPFIELSYEVKLPPEITEEHFLEPEELRAAIVERLKRESHENLFFRDRTQGIALLYSFSSHYTVILPPELDGLPEVERDAKLKELSEWFTTFETALPLSGTVTTADGKHDYTVALVYRVLPLVIHLDEKRAFYLLRCGLEFMRGDPSTWSKGEQKRFWRALFAALKKLTWPHVKALEDKGEPRPDVPKPDRVAAPRGDFFKSPGRLLDTPRHIEGRGQEKLPLIKDWYNQTAFNRTVSMAAAALTKTDTREDIMGIQRATVEEIENLVFWREDGTPAHGQYREDILKAFEALRAIPVPIVKISWVNVGTKRIPRFKKFPKLGIGQLIQTYFPFWKDRATGETVYSDDPGRKKELVEKKPDRRKKTRELVETNPVAVLLRVFPPDKYKLAGMEWRWNTDIAEDFICPQVALDEKNRPRRKPTKGHHTEGSRFVMVNRRYFAVQKHLRAAGMTYAPRLLDIIISEYTHITSRDKGSVWIEIASEKIIKWLGLWTEYQEHPKHALEDHISMAIMELIREKVLLPASSLVPIIDSNPDRRKAPYYRWKVAELWTTVALVSDEEAKIIEAEIEAEAIKVAPEPLTLPEPKAEQTTLPGLEPSPYMPIPSGADIRAARKVAGLNLRRFAEAMAGPDFSTWSRFESGKSIRVKSIKPDTWQRVRDFVAHYKPEGGKEGSS